MAAPTRGSPSSRRPPSRCLPPDARNAATELEQRQHGQLADRRPLTWDANGNLTSKGDLAYRYDYRNRLVDVRDVVSGETLASFTYDAFNRRVTKQTLFAQHETVWAGWRALEEHRDGLLRWRKVYGGGLDEILRLQGDSDGNGTLESSYLPQYDQTGHLAALLDPTGKPVVRYAYSPSGDVTRTTIDPNAPRPTQLRIEGRTGIVVQFSEEISRDELEAALAASGIKVTRPANRNKVEIPFTLAPALERGPKARREWVLTLGEEPAAGEQVELLLDKWSVMDGFLNHPEEDLRFAITWPATSATSRHILEDTDPPRVDLVVAVDGHLEIELSEAPDEATLASAIHLNGQPHPVTLQADGFTFRSDQPLPLGDHLLEVETTLRDRAGRKLEQRFDAAFTWDGTTPALGIFKAESDTTPTNLLRRSRADKDLIADLTGLNLGFQGQPYDPETGLYYFRNRYYDPELGRFITADPLGYVDGPSLYAAFGNDPVNGRDPLGLETKAEWQALLKQDMKDNYGVDLDDWDPSKGFEHNRPIVEAVYQWYSDMHRDYDYMHWTGLAKMAGGRVWEGFDMSFQGAQATLYVATFASNLYGEQGYQGVMRDTGVIQAVQAMQVAFLRINRDIFMDLAWHHKAYAEKGLTEIEQRFAAGEVAEEARKGWQLIDTGRVRGDTNAIWDGNLQFAFHEQSVVVNPGYDDLRGISVGGVPLVAAMSLLAESPVPGGRRFVRVAEMPFNIADFWGQRWKWITDDMWPKWRSLSREDRLRYTGLSLDDLVKNYP